MSISETDREKIDSILLGKEPLKELQPYFSNRETILKYHAQRMTELFPPNKPTNECECCHRHSVELQVAFNWRGIFHTAGTILSTLVGILAGMGGHGVVSYQQMEFTTIHGLCEHCFRKIRVQKAVGKVAEKMCFILIFLSAILLAPVLVMAPVLLASRPTSREITMIIIGLGISTVGMIGGFKASNRATRWFIPESLRFISKAPFQLSNLQKL